MFSGSSKTENVFEFDPGQYYERKKCVKNVENCVKNVMLHLFSFIIMSCVTQSTVFYGSSAPDNGLEFDSGEFQSVPHQENGRKRMLKVLRTV